MTLFKKNQPTRLKKAKGKCEVHPRTGHKGPEGEHIYSSALPSTLALDRGGWPTPCPGHFTPGKDLVPIVNKAGWAPGTGLDECRISRPHWNSIPRPSSL